MTQILIVLIDPFLISGLLAPYDCHNVYRWYARGVLVGPIVPIAADEILPIRVFPVAR